MTLCEKKKILGEYTESIANAQRLRGDMERYTASAASIQREIERYLSRAEDIEGIISLVEDNFQREVLLRKFIYGETLESIGQSFCYSTRQIQRILNSAVSQLKLEMIA